MGGVANKSSDGHSQWNVERHGSETAKEKVSWLGDYGVEGRDCQM